MGVDDEYPGGGKLLYQTRMQRQNQNAPANQNNQDGPETSKQIVTQGKLPAIHPSILEESKSEQQTKQINVESSDNKKKNSEDKLSNQSKKSKESSNNTNQQSRRKNAMIRSSTIDHADIINSNKNSSSEKLASPCKDDQNFNGNAPTYQIRSNKISIDNIEYLIKEENMDVSKLSLEKLTMSETHDIVSENVKNIRRTSPTKNKLPSVQKLNQRQHFRHVSEPTDLISYSYRSDSLPKRSPRHKKSYFRSSSVQTPAKVGELSQSQEGRKIDCVTEHRRQSEVMDLHNRRPKTSRCSCSKQGNDVNINSIFIIYI